MKVKKLEKRIKEITGNEDFELKIKDVFYPLSNIYETYMKKIARLNDAESDIYFLNDEYADEFTTSKDRIIYKMICDNLDYVVEKERKEAKIIVLDLISELFRNQELYNVLESEMENLNNIVCFIYKNKSANKIIKDIIDWFDEWLDEVEEEVLEELYIFSIIDFKLGQYYEYNILPLLQDVNEI